jgi:hypothetical protein
MKQVREIVATCARQLADTVTKVPQLRSGLAYDTGRLLHSLDLLQQVKDTACVSLILPFGNPDNHFINIKTADKYTFDSSSNILIVGPGGCGKTTLGSRISMNVYDYTEWKKYKPTQSHFVITVQAVTDLSPSELSLFRYVLTSVGNYEFKVSKTV